MTEKKRYAILDSLPAYGPMYIPVTDDDEPFYSEGFAVRFYKSDGTEWVANFKPGWTAFNKVFELKNSPNILVIASGTCYIMNPDQTKPISVFGNGYVDFFVNQEGRLILQNQIDLTIIETDGEYWDTERISWDGLKDLKLGNNIVSGLSYDPMNDADEWIDFSYNIESRILIGGSYNRYNIEKKPWWKIW